MPKYRVKSHLTHDQVESPPGAKVTMTEAQAAAIPHAVDPLRESDSEARRIEEKVGEKKKLKK